MRYFFLILFFFVISKSYIIKANEEINIKFVDDPKKIYSFYLDKKDKEVKHGIDIEIGISNITEKSIKFYYHGVQTGPSIELTILGMIKFYYENGIVTHVTSYDYWGKEVASCSVKDDKPYTGNIWSWALGLNGLKWSSILHYQEGKLISDTPYEVEKMSKLLEKLAEIKMLGRSVSTDCKKASSREKQ